MSGARSRRKGVRGESFVRRLFESAGWTVRGLEGEGDHLAFRDGVTLHLESKDQAVLRLPLWIRQANAECPADVLPVVVYKCEGRWRADVDAEQFAALLGRAR